MNEAVPSSKPSLPRRIGRIALRVLLALVLLIAAFAAFVYWKSERGMNQRMQVAGEELAIPTSPEAIARGLELANTYGCLECHGSDGGGKHFLDAMPVLDIRTPNLTRGGRTARWSGRDWARSVRHGVRPDGSMVLFMPATDFRMVDAADLGAIVAYMKSLPPVTRDAGRTRPGPVGRLLYVLGELPLVPAERVDHAATVPTAPPRGPTAEYGRYLANGCTGCHGEHLSGGPIPGVPPEWPPAANITPDRATGRGGSTEADFIATMTHGTRRSGGTIDPGHMPWRQFARFSPDDLHAIYLYLETVPPRAHGGR